MITEQHGIKGGVLVPRMAAVLVVVSTRASGTRAKLGGYDPSAP